MKNFVLFLSCIFVFSSCSNDDEIVSSVNSINESVNLNRVLKAIEFSYKGKVYSSEYYKEGDSVVILDYETQKIYNNLSKNENKFVVVSDNNQITYFDNESEYLEIEKSKLQLKDADTTPYMKIVVRLYRNIDPLFNSSSTMIIEKTYKALNNRYTKEDRELGLIPDLRVYSHNDNISMAKVSLYIGNMTPDFNFRGQAALWMYEHTNYGGEACAAYAATAWNDSQYGPMKPGEEKGETTQIVLGAFKKYNGDSFNDIVSSLKIILTYTNMNKSSDSSSTGGRTDNSSSTNSRGGGETTREERQEILDITPTDGSGRPSSGQR